MAYTYTPTLGVAYGTDNLQFVNYYVTDKTVPLGTIIWIHSGGWRSGTSGPGFSSTVENPVHAAFAQAGYTFLAVNYRGTNSNYGSGGNGQYPNLIDDIMQFLTNVGNPASAPVTSPAWQNTQNYINSNGGWMIAGNSSGGHIAVMAACSYGAAKDYVNYSWPKAILSLAGPMSLNYNDGYTFMESAGGLDYKGIRYYIDQFVTNSAELDNASPLYRYYPPPALAPAPSGWTRSSSNWSKSLVSSATDRNWGIYRSILRRNTTANWGIDGSYTEEYGNLGLTASGLGVDVVIIDTGPVDPNHPEFAVNADGTGGSRVKYFNWFSLASTVGDTANIGGTYSAPIAPITTRKNHANHVAGIAAGNTQGWAPDAHIYTMSTDAVSSNFIFKYIKEWHNQKGTVRPTIVNCSWTRSYIVKNISDINSVTYRGVTYNGPFTASSLNNYGIFPEFNDTDFGSTTTQVLIYDVNSSVDADIDQCFSAGVIIVAAAMNNNIKIAIDSSDVDWDNKLNINNTFFGTTDYYYNRGATPNDSGSIITVGAIRSGASAPVYADGKANYSNRGPGVEIYAPGLSISSAMLDTQGPSYTTPVQDPRNSSYYIGKWGGTSMAAPQVTGLLACVLEKYPSLNQTTALSYLINNASLPQIQESNGGVTDKYDLLGSPNRYLVAPTELIADPPWFAPVNNSNTEFYFIQNDDDTLVPNHIVMPFVEFLKGQLGLSRVNVDKVALGPSQGDFHITRPITYQGAIASTANLPSTGQQYGDAYSITADGFTSFWVYMFLIPV